VQNDISKANAIAREMVVHFGMGKDFGLRYDSFIETGLREFGNSTYDIVDAEIKAILDGCYKSAKKVIESHRDVLDRIAERLLEVETLNGDEIEQLVKDSAVM
jgi:cell division protease FtsH